MSLGGAMRVMLGELTSVGLDPAVVCGAAGVDARVVDDETLAFDLDDLRAVLARAETLASDPLLGLHMAERARGRGVLSHLARAQRTAGDGLEAFRRFAASTWGNGSAIRIARRGATTLVTFALGADVPRHVIEYLVARTAGSLRRSGAPVREVHLPHAPAGPEREYERVLRCPVRLRQPTTSLSLRSADLDRPLGTANPDLAAALATGLAAAPAPPASTAMRLAAAIDDALARGARLDREVLARALGMSGKTLARRLAGEGRGFRDVVDEVRRSRAQRLVAEATLDLGAVATRVGFADLAAFGKAFRRWFGQTPSSFRARPRTR